MAKTLDFYIKSEVDNLQLAALLYEPEACAPKAIVQIVHGMCEHKERYIPFAEFLVRNGYAVVLHDHRGHGGSVRSSRDLGYMYKGGWKAMVEDVRTVAEFAKTRIPGVPVILIGHSMGSMVVRSYVKRYDSSIKQLFVIGSPSDNPAKGAGIMLCKVLGLLGWHRRPGILQNMSFGTFNKPFEGEGYPSAWVCSDKQVLEEYHKDPLCQFVFTTNGFMNLLKLMKDCYSVNGWAMKNPDLPITFLSGSDDPCRTSDDAFASAVDNMRAVGYQNVRSHLYPKMRHEILNESDKEMVWNDIVSQIETHI